MKVFIFNQKSAIARHWFKWYIISLGGREWTRIKPGVSHIRSKSIKEIKESLDKRD